MSSEVDEEEEEVEEKNEDGEETKARITSSDDDDDKEEDVRSATSRKSLPAPLTFDLGLELSLRI